jgi:hypothetical protein
MEIHVIECKFADYRAILEVIKVAKFCISLFIFSETTGVNLQHNLNQ